MRLVVGLGNPGEEYEKTRHNVGFEVLDVLASRLNLKFEKFKVGWLKKSLGLVAIEREAGFALLKPLTYMNRSGEAVSEAVRRFELSPESVFSVSDDTALPVGQIRIRRDGSSGGQKGLQSIVDHLKTDSFPRLRLGVGEPKGNKADFVLSRFSKSERELIEVGLGRAAEAIESWLRTGDLEKCMNLFNKR